MQHTDFVAVAASPWDAAIVWLLVLLFVAGVAVALKRWLRWPWWAGLSAGAVAYVATFFAVTYARLLVSWWLEGAA